MKKVLLAIYNLALYGSIIVLSYAALFQNYKLALPSAIIASICTVAQMYYFVYITYFKNK